MLRRRNKVPVLAEIPSPRGASLRTGALGRGQLRAFGELLAGLDGSASLLLTGPEKTTVATGIAAAATADGRRVALLEGDLASPVLAGTLGLATVPGFRDFLRGDAEARGILQPLVLAGPASGGATEPLACIVAGEPEPLPSTLLHSERSRTAVAKLTRAYDLLVVDGPSLAEDPEGLAALAGSVRSTLLCVERTEVPRRALPAITGLVVFG